MAVRTLVSALAGLLVLLLARGAWADVEVTMEDKVEVFMGSSTQITCMFTSADGLGGLLIRWFYVTKSRDRKKIYEKSPTTDVYDRGTQFTGRIAVNITFSGTSGEAVMTVSDVQLQDEREFICLVKSLTDGVGEGRTMLKVFKTPQNPTFEAVPNGVFVSDYDPSKIGTCEVKDGYPEPQVTWYKNLHPLRDGHDGVMVIPRSSVDKELFSVTSELHMVVKKEDKDALFYCKVMYETPGGTMMQETKPTKITVYYPSTSVRVWVESPKGLIKEGDSLEVLCQGDGHDPSEVVTVTHNTVSVDSNTLVVNNVTRLNSGVYECISLNTNTFEEIKGNTTVFVNYLDPAVVEAKAATVVQGEKLEVTCNALSSLQTLATWFKDGKKISEGHKLMLTVMNFDEAGTYVCVVTVPEIDDMQTSGEVEVHVLGPPQILTAPNTELSEYFDSTVDLNCDIRGFPQSIGWHTPEGKVLKPNYPAETEDGVRSVLTLKVTSDITAVCNISNEYGSSAITYNIKAIKAVSEIPPKKIHKESNNVTIAVIIIFLLLLAILGSVLYFLYKKGRICGRSGKQDLTKDKSSKDNIVVEMKSDNTEEAILLGVNGEKLSPSEQ